MEEAGCYGRFCVQAQGVPGDVVPELKVVFNQPQEICSCGAPAEQRSPRDLGMWRRREGDTACKVRPRRGRAAARPGFGRRPVSSSRRLRGRFGGVRGRRSETFILFCLKSYSFELSLGDSSEYSSFVTAPPLFPEDLRGPEADAVLTWAETRGPSTPAREHRGGRRRAGARERGSLLEDTDSRGKGPT